MARASRWLEVLKAACRRTSSRAPERWRAAEARGAAVAKLRGGWTRARVGTRLPVSNLLFTHSPSGPAHDYFRD